MGTYKDLMFYKKAFELAMDIFEISKRFPKSENTETEVWLDFAFACKYITNAEHKILVAKKEEVGRLLGDIIKNPSKYS
jgi:hypothetical protein